jgi:hypothetical protein
MQVSRADAERNAQLAKARISVTGEESRRSPFFDTGRTHGLSTSTVEAETITPAN